MSANRLKILLAVAVVLLAALIWNWISGWGLVTIHANGESLSKVIKSIERQGGIKLVTNADLTTPVSMDVDRVPPVEAVDVLAARLDGNWSVGLVAGPSKAEISSGLAALEQGERNSNFRTFGFGGGFGGGGFMDVSVTAIDARDVEWKVSDSDKPQLQTWLDQISQKTGLMAMVPRDWDPEVTKTPSGGKAGAAVRDIVKSVNGVSEEIFVLRVQNQDRTADAGPQDRGRPGTDGNFNGQRPGGGGPPGGDRGGRPDFRPEWMEERAMARIAQLPAAEQEQAKKDFSEMRAFFQQMRALPDDQRRQAMQAFFDRPDVQERMAERQAARDEKSGPQRRADRSRRYVERKASMKGS